MDDSINEINKMFEDASRAANDRITINKTALFDALDATGTECEIHVEFDGHGDSGGVSDIVFYSEGNAVPAHEMLKSTLKPVKILVSTSFAKDGPFYQCVYEDTLESVVESIVYDMLNIHHPGWENNEGTYGECIFSQHHRTVELQYNVRYTEHYEKHH